MCNFTLMLYHLDIKMGKADFINVCREVIIYAYTLNKCNKMVLSLCDVCQCFLMSKYLCVLSACDCDPRGIAEQQCNKATGHCVCVEGVSGPRCDTCARGYFGEFPHCERCHQCFAEWDVIIGDLTNQTHRLVQKVNIVKSNGITGPYQDTINNMERSANSIRELLAQNPATQPLTEIQSLLEQAT